VGLRPAACGRRPAGGGRRPAAMGKGGIMLKWRIGEVTVTKILEREEEPVDASAGGFIPAAKPELVRNIGWLRPHYIDEHGKILMSFHAFLVATPTRRILVDTCIGENKQRGIPGADNLKTPFLANLKEAGCVPDAIDTVVCTHLHIDHVGWNTILVNGRWVPTFPMARFLIDKDEFQHWQTQETDPIHRQVFVDSVAPVWDAGLVDLVRPDHRICDEVRLIPTPGHTPGHVSVQIVSKGEEALITGDMIHHPCQFVHPDWSTAFDHDAQQSTRTRRVMFERVADRPILVIGTHFMTPTAGRVIRDGDVYRFAV
jgi:glyoxylase-like metal-dependent hydrolase (beta-lactamase superfamily II)